MNKVERWEDIKDYEGLYQVSSLGRIKTLKPRYKDKIILKQSVGKRFGYSLIVLYKNKVKESLKAHRLVAAAFIPNPEGKPQVNHIDGNKTNNKVENLEWVTQNENIKHAFKTGLAGGHKHNKSKLSEEDVAYIRKNYKAYDSKNGAIALAKKFNMYESSIERVAFGKTYKLDEGEIHNKNHISKDTIDYIKTNYKPYDKQFGISALSRKFGLSLFTINRITGLMETRIKEDDANYILKNYKPRDKEYGCKALAQRFNVNERTIWKITHNKINKCK